ncbi:MAG: FHA domain-containing protein [Planctomycetia bacterium]|nr:FHA domain-containing protein [Planctomycetia bacterium]
MFGKLIPLAGGSPIPLLKKKLLVGRRDECDITLPISTISGRHCELYCEDGYWFVKDLDSSNGVKIDGRRVKNSYIPPNAILSLAKIQYKLEYSPEANGATAAPPMESWDDVPLQSILEQSLLEKAGLSRRTVDRVASKNNFDDNEKRFDPNDDRPGQLRKDRLL